ncbi:response regulator [Algibacter lectus]|uniref:response regulator n=1 Tax=Algibacter lectus TaxID=221126 RepID=UPI001587CAB5|nr:response regulator [Algibacter lectus]
MRILFIDDDKATNFLNKHIAKKNASVSSTVLVDSAFEAIDYLEKKIVNPEDRPDIIFLDINMPAMNGWEFLDVFYKIDSGLIKDIEIVILSSSDDPSDINQFKSRNTLLDFVKKPLDSKLFNDVLLKVCS